MRFVSKSRLTLGGNQVFIVDSGLTHQSALTAFFNTFCGSMRVQFVDTEPATFVAAADRVGLGRAVVGLDPPSPA